MKAEAERNGAASKELVEAIVERLAARGSAPLAEPDDVLCLRDEAGARLPREADTRLGYRIRFYPIWMRVWMELDEPDRERVKDWLLVDKARVIWHCLLDPDIRPRAEADGVDTPEEFAEWCLDNMDPTTLDGLFGPIVAFSGSRLNRWQLREGEEGSDGEPGKATPGPKPTDSSSASSTDADTDTPDPGTSTT